MAESTLSMTFADLYQEVSDSLGTGLAPTGDALTRVKKRVNDGYRRFLSGAMPNQQPHVWSFLKTTATLILVAGTFNVALPDGFQELIGRPKYDTDQSIAGELREATVDEIYDLRQANNNQSGVPHLYAIRTAAATAATVSTRFELVTFPTPIAAYHLVYTYRTVGTRLALATDVPLGAQLHSDTILQAALAAAEQRQDDVIGVHTKLFYEKMASSIAMDRRTLPKNLGYVGSGDDEYGGDVTRNLSYNNVPLT